MSGLFRHPPKSVSSPAKVPAFLEKQYFSRCLTARRLVRCPAIASFPKSFATRRRRQSRAPSAERTGAPRARASLRYFERGTTMIPRHRNALPQLGDTLFLTDGGLETTLVFIDRIDLPHFSVRHSDEDAGRPRAAAFLFPPLRRHRARYRRRLHLREPDLARKPRLGGEARPRRRASFSA